MVLQTTQLKSSHPYPQAEKLPLPKKSLDLWLQQLQLIVPILRQCAAISRLDEQDWQQIGKSIHLTEIEEMKSGKRSPFSEFRQRLGELENNIAQCSTLLSTSKADWRSLASFLSSHR